jgi:hypothetical protein
VAAVSSGPCFHPPLCKLKKKLKRGNPRANAYSAEYSCRRVEISNEYSEYDTKKKLMSRLEKYFQKGEGKTSTNHENSWWPHEKLFVFKLENHLCRMNIKTHKKD